MSSTACGNCGRDVPLMSERCHTCDWPAQPSNVRAAQATNECQALEDRYLAACARAAARGAGDALARFETAIASSVAVLATDVKLVYALFAEDKGLFSTYYQQVAAGSRLPSLSDDRRRQADSRVFPGYESKIRFAALSLDGEGLPTYGDCYLVPAESLISYRTSVMEENSVLFSERHLKSLPKGFRATWSSRAKIAVAKLADQIAIDTPEDGFPAILMRPGKTREEDEFIEVHIWGSMSIQSFVRALILSKGQSRAVVRSVQEKLKQQGLEVEVG